MSVVKRHYDSVSRQVAIDCPMGMANLTQPFVIVPLERWTRITEKGLRFAMRMSDQIQAGHVDAEDCCDEVKEMWGRNSVSSVKASGRVVPELVPLPSPYRFVLVPLVEYILKVE